MEPSAQAASAAALIRAPAATQQALLPVILGIIASLGGTANADQPFMEAGIDSLGKFGCLEME